MSKTELACCYFPTSLVCVDDSELYLKNLLTVFSDRYSLKTFSQPGLASNYLNTQCRTSSFVSKWISTLRGREIIELEENEMFHSSIEVDLFAIHKEIYSADRFKEVSVVISDYSMSEMKGIEFFNSIKAKNKKSILLTGDATLDIAIEAFNKGLIDKFVRKDDENFFVLLDEAIRELQKEYFLDLSEVVIKSIVAKQTSCLDDPIFIQFFNQFIKDHDITEYYLVSESGCFLCLDLHGNMSWLVVKGEPDMVEYADIAEGNSAPKKVLQPLQDREKVLFLFSKEDYTNIAVTKWDKYMFPSTTLVGQNGNFYYAYIDGPSIYKIHQNKIISYDKFLDSL